MFIVDKLPKSITAESYRSLRTNIQYSSIDKQVKTLVVTSSNAGEGKSTVAGLYIFSKWEESIDNRL